jgi:hypothetical protein
VKRALMVSLVAAGMVAPFSLYAAAKTSPKVDGQIEKIMVREQELAHELVKLEAEVKELKQQQILAHSPGMLEHDVNHAAAKSSASTSPASSTASTEVSDHADKLSYSRRATNAGTKNSTRHNREGRKTTQRRSAEVAVVDEDIRQAALRYMGGTTVTTSPLLGLKSAFDASDLLYQVPSMNEDLMLLRRRGHFEHALEHMGGSLNDRPILVLSGGLEGQVLWLDPYARQNDGDVNLSAAELDFWPIVSSWASGFISLVYDDAPASTGTRVDNSRIFLQRGFLTLGNLEKLPVYFTIGQMYAPFGQYSSAMLTTPVTKSLGRIEARIASIGFFKNGFYSEVYGFNGEQSTDVDNFIPHTAMDIFKQGGINIGWEHHYGFIDGFDIGSGLVSNIAESQGMQNNGLSSTFGSNRQFSGFGEANNGNALGHNVPGVDIHMEASKGVFTLITEYVTATRRFNSSDLMYNGAGAFVSAMHIEGDLNFDIHNKPLTIGFSYGQTWQSLALNLPKQSYAAVVSTSLWKDTMVGLEYRHDTNYAVTSATTGGRDGGTIALVNDVNVGGTQNIITMQMGVYF